MNVKEIKELLELMAEHQVSHIELEKGDMKVKLSKGSEGGSVIASPAPQIISQPVAPAAAAASASPETASAPAPAAQDEVGVTGVQSPMVGTFYSSPSPDQPPFVSVGQKVKEGDVLCIIEAMKLMNEIKAEVSGTISEILIENGQAVEYDQVILKIKKD